MSVTEEEYGDKVDEVRDFLLDQLEESNFTAMTEEVITQDLSEGEFTEEQVRHVLNDEGFSSYHVNMKVWVPDSEAGMFESKYDWVISDRFWDRIILAFLIALFLPIAILMLVVAIPLAVVAAIIAGPIYLAKYLMKRFR